MSTWGRSSIADEKQWLATPCRGGTEVNTRVSSERETTYRERKENGREVAKHRENFMERK